MNTKTYLRCQWFGLAISTIGFIIFLCIILKCVPTIKNEVNVMLPVPVIVDAKGIKLTSKLSGDVNYESIKAVHIQFKDTGAYVKYSIPERFDNMFILNLMEVSKKYNVSDLEPSTGEMGKCTMDWNNDVLHWIKFREDEVLHLSPPLRSLTNGKLYFN